jgi:hypothetical protein
MISNSLSYSSRMISLIKINFSKLKFADELPEKHDWNYQERLNRKVLSIILKVDTE